METIAQIQADRDYWKKKALEYEKSLEVNVSIISNLYQAFHPLKESFDIANRRQVIEAERRLAALND